MVNNTIQMKAFINVFPDYDAFVRKFIDPIKSYTYSEDDKGNKIYPKWITAKLSFFSAEYIYNILKNQFQNRIVRYDSEDEFIGYMTNTFLTYTPRFYSAIMTVLEDKIDTLMANEARGKRGGVSSNTDRSASSSPYNNTITENGFTDSHEKSIYNMDGLNLNMYENASIAAHSEISGEVSKYVGCYAPLFTMVNVVDGLVKQYGIQDITGPAGRDGANGANGANGVDGKDGKDGLGLDMTNWPVARDMIPQKDAQGVMQWNKAEDNYAFLNLSNVLVDAANNGKKVVIENGKIAFKDDVSTKTLQRNVLWGEGSQSVLNGLMYDTSHKAQIWITNLGNVIYNINGTYYKNGYPDRNVPVIPSDAQRVFEYNGAYAWSSFQYVRTFSGSTIRVQIPYGIAYASKTGKIGWFNDADKFIYIDNVKQPWNPITQFCGFDNGDGYYFVRNSKLEYVNGAGIDNELGGMSDLVHDTLWYDNSIYVIASNGNIYSDGVKVATHPYGNANGRIWITNNVIYMSGSNGTAYWEPLNGFRIRQLTTSGGNNIGVWYE